MNSYKIDKYRYNDGTFKLGTRVVLLHNKHLNEIDPIYIGQSAKITTKMIEDGSVIYAILFNDNVQHTVFEDYIEFDKKYYRNNTIDNILNA